jgi:hypothetical protein
VGQNVTDQAFGNVEMGRGTGLTLGFWSNKNGQAAMGKVNSNSLVTSITSTLNFLSTQLNLKNANGTDFDPTTYAQFRTWILGATATNMAYMLSAQLATMELNVYCGFVSANSSIYAPGTAGAIVGGAFDGYNLISNVMSEANTDLGTVGHNVTLSGNTYRAHQETLKNALDNANNNVYAYVLAWHDNNHNGVVDPGEIY